jgi:hypothetical protein
MIALRIIAALAGGLAILLILQDSIETIVIPRRIARKLRIARAFYRLTWWMAASRFRHIHDHRRREYFISFYGPLSQLLLLALWACVLIFGFALLQWSLGSALHAPDKPITFWTDLYMSGTTFFTLGLGDVIPSAGLPRLLTVLEGGLGFGTLALIIGYVPVIYQAFSHRESQITLMDARAGSPPTGLELLRRHDPEHNSEELIEYLRSWEHWCSELLESHISYPVLMFYRSQHEHQSWLAALTTILDVSALIMVGIDRIPEQVGRFTFAIARHAVVDLTQALGLTPVSPVPSRLVSEDFSALRQQLTEMSITLNDPENAEARLADLRELYEPYINVLAYYLLMPVSGWITSGEAIDDWQTSAWDHFALTSQKPLKKRSLSPL